MSLLGSIAAALSDGVGGGMVANAKWGEEKAAQAKKEAAENARLKEQLKRYDDDRQSRDKYYAGLLEESKNERLSRAEQALLDRENNLKIAGMRDHGGGSNTNLFRGLEFVDSRISDFDKSIGLLAKARDEEIDPKKQSAIDAQIDVFKQQRQAFITNPATLKILDSSGEYGQAYKASLFGAEQEQPGATQEGNIPASLVVPPPRAVVKPDQGLGSGLLSQMSEANQASTSGSVDDGSTATGQAPAANDLEAVGQRYIHGGSRGEQLDWSKVKAPQGGWRSPVHVKEVPQRNGTMGYTLTTE